MFIVMFTLLSFYVAQFYCSLLVNVWADIFGLYHSDMDMSFLYSHKPVLYPVAVSAFDQQCVDDDDDGSNTVLSLVQLSCQKIVQVCGFQGIDFLFLFLSRPRSEGWPHHGRTFSIYPCPLSF